MADDKTLFDTPIAQVPVSPIVSFGTGVREMTFTELRHLFATGRTEKGVNYIAITRDSGSGTRIAWQNSLGVEPSWGVGDNVGPKHTEVTIPGSILAGPNFLPSNKGGSGTMELTVDNCRLGIGYTGSERGFGRWLTGGRFELAAVKDDIDGGTDFVRPTASAVLNNGLRSQIDPSTGVNYPVDGYRIGGPETFVTIGDPEAEAAVPFGGTSSGLPAMRNPWAAGYLNNITRSIAAFVSVPGGSSTLFTPGELLATQFILTAGTDYIQDPTCPSEWVVSPIRNQSVQNFIATPGNNVLSDPAYATFGTVSVNGNVPTREVLAAGSYSDGVAMGMHYIDQLGNPVNYTDPLTSRNRISGDFSGDGARDKDDIPGMIAAWRERNGGPNWNPPGGIGLGSDLVFEIVGDFDNDGNFDSDDVRYFADGLAVDSSGRVNRCDGFFCVDEEFGGNFFGTILAHGSYDNGDSVADVSNPNLRNTPGFSPGYGAGGLDGDAMTIDLVGADGRVDGYDIDYVNKHFKQNPNVTDCALNWDNLDEAVCADFSADVNGDGIIDQCDIDKILSILETTYGDVNLDGVCNAADKAIVVGNQGNMGGWADGDVNGDGNVDGADLVLINLKTCPGDANGDGTVDINDLNAVLGNFGAFYGAVCGGGITINPGDLNDDGAVDIADLNLVLGNFGTGCP